MRKLSLIAALACAACSSGSPTKDDTTRATATPAFSVAAGTHAQPISVAITSASASAVIRYTTDGADPTEASSTYGGPIAISAATTVKAVATAPGLDRSAVATAAYAFRVAAPAFSLDAGTYATAQEVALSTSTPGATLRYTTNGAEPSGASDVYTAPIALAVGGAPQTTVIKVIGVRAGFTDSAIQSASYTIDAGASPAATPTFSPGPGTYTSAQSVHVASTTAGAEIHCTTDGTPATAASPVCSGAISVAATATIRAIATAPGHTASAEATAAYTIGGGGTGGDWMAFCGTLVNKEAALAQSCEQSNPALFAVPYTSNTFCLTVDREIAAGRVGYDATVGAACASAIAALGCSGLDASGDLVMPAACDGLLAGRLAIGVTCATSLDCATGYCTSGGGTQACGGTCQPHAGEGASCDSADCGEGLSCMSNGPATRVCVRVSGVNGPCPCEDGLWCDASSGPSPVCSAPKTSGDCLDEGECAYGYGCFQNQCTARVGAGADCTSAPCGQGYTCSAETGTCTSQRKSGMSCTQFDYCIDGYCDGGTCALYKPIGAQCENLWQCATGACTAGHCALGVCTM